MKNHILSAALILFVTSTQAAKITVNTVLEYPVSATDGFCMLNEAVSATNTNVASGSVAGECIAGESQPVTDVIDFDLGILPAYIAPFNELLLTESLHIKGPGKEL